ncbi:hypothetical protein NL676_026996 [Syzygium grande]|nr:hypothetical protein NL676_026996 [Syzygium grande]
MAPTEADEDRSRADEDDGAGGPIDASYKAMVYEERDGCWILMPSRRRRRRRRRQGKQARHTGGQTTVAWVDATWLRGGPGTYIQGTGGVPKGSNGLAWRPSLSFLSFLILKTVFPEFAPRGRGSDFQVVERYCASVTPS